MSTSPFNAAAFGFPGFDPASLQRMSQQWFASMTPSPAQPDPFAWFRPAQPAPTPFDPTSLAQQWMAQMQQLAAQFGGGVDAQAADITRAWRTLVGENPFAQALASNAFMPASFGMPGAARGPFEQPAFGYTREHQERAQAFAKSIADFQQAAQAFGGLINEAGQEAFKRFESLLAQRGHDGRPVESARGLFDLWIDAAEDAYADIAMGDAFQKAFGDYVNAQMRVRAGMQKEAERMGAQWGLPGREEVDAAHRKIASLERDVRRLRDAIDALGTPRGGDAPVESTPASKPTSRPAARKTGQR